MFNFEEACNRRRAVCDRLVDSFIGYASEIKETANGSRRSAISEAGRTREV
jgi:hypothetical protein